MSDWQLKTPVAFIIFNRPDTTERVFEKIRQAQPPKLLVVADGPRANRQGEVEKCTAARAIIGRVDWNCEVLMNYSDTNMGCKQRVSNGLNWVFDNVEEAIILEDDCLPDLTFFRFCDELLEKYRDDERIGMISGDNFQFSKKRTIYSYYFSRYNHIWGWASWRRAWKKYDGYIKLWSEIRDKRWLEDILDDKRSVSYWTNIFNNVYEGNIDSWDYPWTFACWINNFLTILPNVNLVTNIGFSEDSTHTKDRTQLANLSTEAMCFPLKHPEFMIRDTKADNFTQNSIFRVGLLKRIFRH